MGFQQKPSGAVLLVLMDEISAKELNIRSGQWDRAQLAMAIDNLCTAGADTIGLDIILSSQDADPKSDLALSNSIERCNNVVLARVASAKGHEINPIKIFQTAAIGDGFIDFTLDEDGILRSIPLLNAKPLEDGSIELQPCFAIELARVFLGIEFDFDFSHSDYFILGKKNAAQIKLPYPNLIIHYFGDASFFNNLSFVDVVKNRFDHQSVKGKIIIIGSTLSMQKDFYGTPISRFDKIGDAYRKIFGKVVSNYFSPKDPGIVCHANAVETVLSQQFIKKVPEYQIFALIFIFALTGIVFYMQRINISVEMLLLFGGLASVIALGHGIFIYRLIDLDIVSLICALILQFGAGIFIQKHLGKKKTAIITNLFGKYVSHNVLNELLKEDINATIRGRKEEITIFFSDLRNFTALSERLGAEKTSVLLNTYFNEMLPLVTQNLGTVDKIMGDAIMAFFGAPLKLLNHPIKAAETANRMLEASQKLRINSQIEGIDRLFPNIGLNTGTAIVGNLGSDDFMDYTVIGDAVNLASRLEGLNKEYNTNIILSEFTRAKLDERFMIRKLDRVRVKGKDEIVTIFESMGFRDKSNDPRNDMINGFEAGLDAYFKQDWDVAEKYFKQTLERFPKDYPTILFLNRIKNYRENPPINSWAGETIFDYK